MKKRDVKPRGYWTPERVCIDIQKRISDGEDLSATVVRMENRSLYNNARKCHGNWESALTASGLFAKDYVRMRTKREKGFWTPETTCSEIQKRAEAGEMLTVKEVSREDSSLVHMAKEFYGNWETALTASGLVAKDYMVSRARRSWSEETVKNEIQKRKDAGLSLEREDVLKDDRTLVNKATKYFGVWEIAIATVKK